MTKSAAESHPQLYDVYYSTSGDRIIVIGGLDPGQRTELGPLQQLLLPHVEQIVALYWIIVLAVALYLVGVYLVLPLLHQFKKPKQ